MALNDAQRVFVEEYLKNGMNSLQAYLVAYPASAYESAKGNSARLLADPEVQSYIQESQTQMVERNKVTKDELIGILLSIAKNERNRNSDRINSVLGIAKMCGYITNKVDITSKGRSLTLQEMLEFTPPQENGNKLLPEGNTGK